MATAASGSNKPDEKATTPVPPSGGAPNEATAKADVKSTPVNKGLKGLDGFDLLDPDKKESKGDLFKRAQLRAPSLTEEFVAAYKLSDEHLAGIANGEIPPPPAIGPVHSTDLYLTPGGWQQTPIGVAPADVGANPSDGRF